MRRIVHYTIGFHNPPMGGVETAILDIVKMTDGLFQNIVLCKNGDMKLDLNKKIPTLKSTKGRSRYCSKFKESFSYIPDDSQEFDESTLERISDLKPDVIIIYGGDCNSMYIPILKLSKKARILVRIQKYTKSSFPVGIINMTDGVIVFDEDTKKRILNLDVKVPIYVLPKVYDDKIFNTSNREKHTGEKFLYTGRFNPIKMLPEAILSFNKLKKKYNMKHTFKIIGQSMPASYHTIMTNAINKNRKGIHFSSKWLCHKDLANEYKKCDFVFIPSKYETFCSSALEALACGATLVINNSTMKWADGLCINGKNLVTQEGFDQTKRCNPDGILAVLDKCMRGDYTYEDYSEIVFERYSYSKGKKAWLEVLNG